MASEGGAVPPDRAVAHRRTRPATFYLGGMGRTWVLHTETKGTGAQMVPLEQVQTRSTGAAPLVVPRKPRQAPKQEEPGPRDAHRFRIVDVVTRETLTDGASTAEAVEVLRGLRSPVDFNVYVWREQPGRWRLLTLQEKRLLWDLRHA